MLSRWQIFGDNGKDSQQIAISYRPLFSRVIQGELFHGPASMRFNALENEPFAVGEAGHAARAFQGAAYSARAAQLEDSGRIHVSLIAICGRCAE